MSKLRIVVASFLIPLLLIGILNVPRVSAAPSGAIEVEEDNVLQLGDSTEVVVTFRNTATTGLDDVASTIQYITLAAADLNPSRALIALNASWEIYKPGDSTPRASGNVTGSLDENAIYAPYSAAIYLYTWALGQPSNSLIVYTEASQFATEPTLKVLRPGESLKLTITVECQNVVGDSRIWFFFRATEAAYTTGSYPTAIIDTAHRQNLYYSKLPGPGTTKYWLPLHNSYDPYDSGIGTGHSFEQHSWEIKGTTHAFAKANKLVHQKPIEDPELLCIDIIKRGPATAQIGDNITYEFTVANCGDVDLSSVKVTDSLLGTEIWSIATLAVGQSLNFTFPYTIPAASPDPLTNNATATGWYEGEEVTDSDSHSVDIVEEGDPCIDIIKEGPAVARIGDTITYEFTITNCGAMNLADVTVTDPLLISLSKNIGDLAVGANYTFTVPYTIPDPPPSDPLSNNATASGKYNDEEVTDWDSHSVNIDRYTFSFHICGVKFEDLDRNGKYDVEIEPGINGVTVALLGADKQSKAEIYYPGDFAYPSPEANPLESGENQLRGSYCFNLENVDPAGGIDKQGTYEFYVKIEEPPDRMATTPMLIGPITLSASYAGPRESLNKHFGNAIPPVGGEAYPADKLAILAPWLALAAALIAGSTVVIRKHRAQS